MRNTPIHPLSQPAHRDVFDLLAIRTQRGNGKATGIASSGLLQSRGSRTPARHHYAEADISFCVNSSVTQSDHVNLNPPGLAAQT